MVVVRPALHDREVTGHHLVQQVGQEPVNVHPVARGSDAGSMRGPATSTVRKPGTAAFAMLCAAATLRSRCSPTPGTPDADQADLLVRAVAEPVTQLLAPLEQVGVEAR